MQSPASIVARIFVVLTVLFCVSSPLLAVEPGEILKDPALEARAREISAELRCLVCQNQSIDDSNADLARDLRVLVRDRLKAGDSNVETINYIVERYGEFVLLRPRFGAHTLILWLGPLLIFLLAGFVLFRYFRSGSTDAAAISAALPQPLSATEQKRLDALLGDAADVADREK